VVPGVLDINGNGADEAEPTVAPEDAASGDAAPESAADAPLQSDAGEKPASAE
jgi:L-threonylcarbamoyladenylate synthase